MHPIQTVWRRIELQLQRLAPSVKATFQSGASDATLQLAEAFIPMTLPEEVKTLYRIHDGQADRSYLHECTGLVDGWHFLPLERMCNLWLINRSEAGPPWGNTYPCFICPHIEHFPDDWHPHWIPFIAGWNRQYCVDLAPGPNGRPGQILLFNDRLTNYPDLLTHACSPNRVVASGIEEFFTILADDLETGLYSFDEETDMLWSQPMRSVVAATKTKAYGYDEETGRWVDSGLGALKRERQRFRRKAFPIRNKPEWEALYAGHPQWNPWYPPAENTDPF